jgi:putative addiction module component (TIGR02574 family)
MSTEELLAAALKLPRDERAKFADELLSSLEEPEEDVATAWAAELERRSREVAEGRVQPIDWDTARDQIQQALQERRAARHSS